MNLGDEREMRICHSQPHLVPPMHVSLDGHSKQDRPLRASLPSWTVEGRDRVSKASIQTGMSRKPTAPLRISAPSDFRKVESFFMPKQEPYSPLELSIHTSTNRLSSLPNFEDFQLQEPQARPIAPPPRVLTHSQFSCSRSYRPGVSYQFRRKPVRSGSLQSSLAVEQYIGPQLPVSSPLIPHFSTRIPTSIALSDSAWTHAPSRPVSDNGTQLAALNREQPRTPQKTPPPTVPKTPTAPRTPSAPRTPPTSKAPATSKPPERPLPPVPSSTSPTNPRQPPRTPEHRRTPSSKSGRITQWLMTTNKTPSPYSTPPNPTKDTSHIRSRTRALSTSTVASTLSNWTAGLRTTPSLSSNVTAATTAHPSSQQDIRIDKEFEVAISRPNTTSSSALPAAFGEENCSYSTIYEDHQQPRNQLENGFEKCGYNSYANYRESAIGLAF